MATTPTAPAWCATSPAATAWTCAAAAPCCWAPAAPRAAWPARCWRPACWNWRWSTAPPRAPTPWSTRWASPAARGTGAGAFNSPITLVNSRTVAVDINCGEAAIPFLAWARAAGCLRVVDGLGMLVEQAAEAFEAWHGVRPDTQPVYEELRAQHARLVTAD